MSNIDHILFYDLTTHFFAPKIEYEQQTQPILLKTCQIMFISNINTEIGE